MPAPTGGQQQLIVAVRQQAGDPLADALASQAQLSQAIDQESAQQQALLRALRDSQQRIVQVDQDMAGQAADSKITQRRLDADRLRSGPLARSMYVRPVGLWTGLATAHGLSEGLLRVADLIAVTIRAQELRRALEQDQRRLTSERRRLAADHSSEASLRAERAADSKAIQQLLADQQQASIDLAGKIQDTRSQLSSGATQADLAGRIAADLTSEQRQITQAAAQRLWSRMALTLLVLPVDVGPVSLGHSQRYRFIWPEPQATIAQGFGPSTLATDAAYDGTAHFHTGIDLVASAGSPVLAADDGMAVAVGSDAAGYGTYVMVAHARGLVTLYAHLDQASIGVGDHVQQGQQVGQEGSTGDIDRPDLLLEVRVNGLPVDPAAYLPPGPPSPFNE